MVPASPSGRPTSRPPCAWSERQVHQGPHGTGGAQHCISELEQSVAPAGKAPRHPRHPTGPVHDQHPHPSAPHYGPRRHLRTRRRPGPAPCAGTRQHRPGRRRALLPPLTTLWRITRREGSGPATWDQCDAYLRSVAELIDTPRDLMPGDDRKPGTGQPGVHEDGVAVADPARLHGHPRGRGPAVAPHARRSRTVRRRPPARLGRYSSDLPVTGTTALETSGPAAARSRASKRCHAESAGITPPRRAVR